MGQGVPYVASENALITMIQFSFILGIQDGCLVRAMFIGKNETRAGVLEVQAEKAMERLTTISNKGRQQITDSSSSIQGWIQKSRRFLDHAGY